MRGVALVTTGATVLALAGYAGSSGTGGGSPLSPADAMQQAEDHLDHTGGIRLTLSTDGDPGGDSYLTGAQGVITTAPAFQGTASGRYQGIPASDIDVVSVGGKFYVDVPIRGFTELKPADLCAPDPALLLDPDTGIASILVAATGLSAGSAQRGGQDNKETLTPYSGSVPGPAVQNILPCSKGTSYDATFTVSADGYLRSAKLSGDFAGDGHSIAYTIDVQAYDVHQDISAP